MSLKSVLLRFARLHPATGCNLANYSLGGECEGSGEGIGTVVGLWDFF